MESETRLRRTMDAIEGLSIGDAYGNHHGQNRHKRGAATWEYSDDTLMALSIVETLRKYGEIQPDALARSFAERWDGARGYGQGVTRLIKSIQRGANWRTEAAAMFDGQGSAGNGAAMRAAPVGAYFADDLSQVVEQARLSAIVTHTHPEGIAGAIAVAVGTAVAYQYRQAGMTPDYAAFLDRVAQFVPESEVRRKIILAQTLDMTPIEAAKILGNGRPVLAQLTVPFALWSAGRNLADFSRAITQTAVAQGDVDTNCAIVGGMVVMLTSVEKIPAEWTQRRENLPVWAFEDETN